MPLLGGYAVVRVDGSGAFVPEAEWGKLLEEWVPRLEDRGGEWPEFPR